MNNRSKIVLLIVINNGLSLVLTIIVGIGVNLATGGRLSSELDPLQRFLLPLALVTVIASTGLSVRLFLLDRREQRAASGPSWRGLHGQIKVGRDLRTGQGSRVTAVDATYSPESGDKADHDRGGPPAAT